ncbi:hypothetical protein LTR17_004467 [Elasticomyces elasticus]|nr:hypothetical protein LTR17_004467 [Elasticomyces elasticus]
MLDPLTAVSLAASIVAFVDFGSKLLLEGYGAYKSQSGASEDSIDTEKATNRLQELAERLALPQGASRTKGEVALSNLAAECVSISQELVDVLEELKVVGTGPKRTWEAGKMTVLRHVVKKDKIVKLQKKLDKAQKDINTHLLAILKDDQSSVKLSLRDIAQTSERMHFTHLSRIDRTSKDVMTALQDQKGAMKSLAASWSKAEQEQRAATESYEKALNAVLSSLQALQHQSAVIATSSNVLDSLAFGQMHSRHQQIQKEYPKTFSWAFDGSVNKLPTWLEHQDGIFWLSGKAGSGKSTLMKYIAGHAQTNTFLRKWATDKGKNCVIASFYFWNAGGDKQKSQEGLLQSLIYQTFSKCPEIIQLACPKDRWDADDNFHRNPKPWELSELVETFKSIVAHGDTLSKCFCFFIDGLDEYTGDHFDLTEAFDSFAQSKWIKLCVSSRPRTVFKNAYEKHQDRMLVLQLLTKSDMDQYITGMLEEDKRFQILVQRDQNAWRLVTTIRERAQGVFLWVYLVVRRLRRLLGENCRLQTLEEALEALPSDLTEYFKHMVDSIDELHRRHTAGTFQLAIYEAPLPLIAFWYLPTVLNTPDEVLDAPVECKSDDSDLIVQSREQIDAWCKDLLEVQENIPDSGSIRQMDYRIDFLHRTVRDFLTTDVDIQNMFNDYLPSDFSAATTMMRLYLKQAKNLKVESGRDKHLRMFAEIANEFFYHAKRCEKSGKGIELDFVIELEHVGHHFRNLDLSRTHWTNVCHIYVPKYSNRTSLGESNFLAFAVAYDLSGFVRHRLQRYPEEARGASGALLLNYALHPVAVHDSLKPNRLPSYDMVLLLLQGGANVNAAASDKTTWAMFLQRCYHEPDDGLWPVARLLLKFGGNPTKDIQDGSESKWRVNQAAHRPYQIAVPKYISTEQCLQACCSGEQLTELGDALEEAKASRRAISKPQRKSLWDSLPWQK